MSWLIALLVLAVAAFFIVKSMKSGAQNAQSEHDRLQQERLSASGEAQNISSADEQTSATGSTAEIDRNAATTDASVAASTSTAAAIAQAAGGSAVAAAAGVAAYNTGTASAESGEHHGSDTRAARTDSDSTGIDTGDTLSDVREMIKILNLDGPDAGRLAIERDQLIALRKGESSGYPDDSALGELATRLRSMLA